MTDMLDAWLAGEVPAAVMADWAEERGSAFPRTLPTLSRMRVRSRSGARTWFWPMSKSGSATTVDQGFSTTIWGKREFSLSSGRRMPLNSSRSGTGRGRKRGSISASRSTN